MIFDPAVDWALAKRPALAKRLIAGARIGKRGRPRNGFNKRIYDRDYQRKRRAEKGQ